MNNAKKLLSAVIACSAVFSGSAMANPLQFTGTVSNSGCTVSGVTSGTVVEAATGVLSSSTADGGTPVTFTVTTTDNTWSISLGDPVVTLNGATPVTMNTALATTFEMNEPNVLFYVDQQYTGAVSLPSAGTYDFELNYSDTATAGLSDGNYTVDTVVTCSQ